MYLTGVHRSVERFGTEREIEAARQKAAVAQYEQQKYEQLLKQQEQELKECEVRPTRGMEVST
jgi:hypothetical protein